MKRKLVLFMVIAFAVLCSGFPLNVSAGEKTLKLASWGAPKHYAAISVSGWAKDVNEALPGKYKVVEYPGGQLYGPKDMHMALAKGSVDLGVVLQPAALGLVPMLQGVYLPFGIDNLDDAAKAYSGESLAIINKALAKKRIKLLCALFFAPTQIFSAKKNIDTTSDLKGLRILSQSPIVTEILAKMGSAPDPSIPNTEQYMALKRGVSDAVLTGIVGGYFNKTFEVAPFVTKLDLSFPTAFIAMNLKKFEKLSKEAQDVMMEMGRKHTANTVQMAKGWDAKFTGELAKQGATISTLPPEERAKIKAVAQKSWKKWADENGPDAKRLLELNCKL